MASWVGYKDAVDVFTGSKPEVDLVASIRGRIEAADAENLDREDELDTLKIEQLVADANNSEGRAARVAKTMAAAVAALASRTGS